MRYLPITKLVMDDICKSKSDVYQVAFYKIEDFEIEKKICLNIEQYNCNKVRIIDLEVLKKENILYLPDVLIIQSNINLTKEEQQILTDLNITLHFIDESIMINDALFEQNIKEIERKIYKSKTLKYIEIKKEEIGNIENKYDKNVKNKIDKANLIIGDMLELIKDKDEITYTHVKNVSDYVDIFISGLPENEQLTEEEIRFLKKACLVHDIGKLIIPNQILKKKSSLSKDEYHDMKKHVSENAYLFNSKIMNEYKEIALSHHERYDGLGYPNGLKEEEIPYYARIISVLDAFEAMTGNRDYVKEEDRKTLYEVLDILINNSGTQFDPNVVKYFIYGIIKNKGFELELKHNMVKIKKKMN